MKAHDTISISPGASPGTLQMALTTTLSPNYFDPPVTLNPGPDNGYYYWYGKSNGVDFFVMLADDKKGQATPSDSARKIEEYIRVEAFLQSNSDQDCLARRPDAPVYNGKGVGNFHAWVKNDSTCAAGTLPAENGAGGGGHTYP
jgi:hypothetical protein